MPPSLQDLSAKLDSMTARADEKDNEYKEAMEKNDKDHKDAMTDMEKKNHDAMEEKEKDAKKAMHDEKEKHEATLKAVLVAMEEPDKDKREALLKAAIEHKDDQHTQTAKNADHMEDEEKKAMKAQLEYQNNIIKKPKLQILEAAYSKVGTDKSKLEEYKADWNNMTLPQLDAAIEMAKPIIELTGEILQVPTPLGLSEGMSTFTGSLKTDDEYAANIDKMSTEELFHR